ncbi:helix-turn-helix domain-containing protein [Cognatishimia maritima]|uniref:Transcriptional regulator, XRE family with cupin sensor n=1 Tax=Cognatishimia maritima TaxID=870908 RepID=A0A1M5NGV4_9RHOB|nr:XRE family transcriptional regulator [Cognatishimia maritima]SHG88732.1 transcriptional regulator, XRE family with cupin sensor [Cognatishimia maritima]
MKKSSTDIQINLKAIRGEAGLSLSATEALTGVSKSMLGQIERGESSPTIATLWKLSKGLKCPLSALITEPPETAYQFQDSISGQTLFPFDPALGSETFVIGLAPGLSHESAAHRAGVIEDIYAIDGDFEVFIDGTWQTIRKGEAKRFAADQPHGYRNLGPFPVHFHNTMHYPS